MNNPTPIKLVSGQPVPNVDRSVGDPVQIPLFRQYLRIAIRWRLVLAGCLFGCIALALIITLLMAPKYTATSTLEISRDSNRIVNIQGVQQDASIEDQEFYQTQYGLLRARSLSERVVVQLNLADDPAFFAMFHERLPNAIAPLMSNGRAYLSSGHAERVRRAGEVLLKHVGVSPMRMSRLTDISFTSPDAEFSARLVNAWPTECRGW